MCAAPTSHSELQRDGTSTANSAAALNSFIPATRALALQTLLAAQSGADAHPAVQPIANLHCHSFFSFNAYGYSPTGLAWLARTRGWSAVGLIDFDVLDGVDEFLAATDAVGVRGSCGIETRVFFPEFSTRETSSPGEPGVFYHIGLGFTSSTAPAAAQPMLDDLRSRSRQRNINMVQRINAHLAPVTLDYERDVLPLTPAGNATERHMVEAYITAVETQASDYKAFWADKLGMTASDVEKMIATPAAYRNTVRAKLMKKGGVGYVQPDGGSFPSLDDVTRFIQACGALPCYGWVDGASEGEQAIDELLETVIAKGVVMANIVPDRNWNFSDPALRAAKAQQLDAFIEKCQQQHLPLNIGTEMNSPGNKLIDDFDVPELEKHRDAFLDGAYFIYGHTVMQRWLDMGYQSAWTQAHLLTRASRNAFYTAIGKAVEPGAVGQARLQGIDQTFSPAQVITHLA